MNAQLLPNTGAIELTSSPDSVYNTITGFFQQAIQLFNTNEGFFSFLLSLIAIWVSIIAIRSQNKGVMYEKRLALFSEANRIYTMCKRIVDRVPSQNYQTQIRLIGIIMFNQNSKEAEIVRNAYDFLKTHEGNELPGSYQCDYFEIYNDKFLSSSFVDEIEVFYCKRIYSAVKEMYDAYDDLRMGFLVLTKDEIDEQVLKLAEALGKIEKRKTIQRMKSKLPL